MASLSSRPRAILITGACGEIGRNLLEKLALQSARDTSADAEAKLIAIDLRTPPPSQAVIGVNYLKGDITDPTLFEEIESEYDCRTIFHLAAILSAGGERDPERAFSTNTDGTMNVLSFAERMGSSRGDAPTKVIFPSSIAVYGLPTSNAPDAEELKGSLGAICEDSFLEPITMYGVNKLAAEHLGRYFSRHYRLLSRTTEVSTVDFRCVRFPGVLSANTLPTEDTSDYAPAMVHSAAQGRMYECFARPRTTIPFIALPDAVKALISISKVPLIKLSRSVYNVRGFSVSAQSIAAEIKRHFPDSAIVFKADSKRIGILQSWPAEVDDAAAKADWGWCPDYGFESAFRDYLIPGVRKLYESDEDAAEMKPLQAVV